MVAEIHMRKNTTTEVCILTYVGYRLNRIWKILVVVETVTVVVEALVLEKHLSQSMKFMLEHLRVKMDSFIIKHFHVTL